MEYCYSMIPTTHDRAMQNIGVTHIGPPSNNYLGINYSWRVKSDYWWYIENAGIRFYYLPPSYCYKKTETDLGTTKLYFN
jgi:hypothetical protein